MGGSCWRNAPKANQWPDYGNFRAVKSKLAKRQKQALIRELREELGIDTAESCLAPLSFASHHYAASDDGDAFHLLMMLFVCRRWQGRPQAVEGGMVKWVRPQQLRDYPMPAADIPLISALQDLL
jgi:8-oxo-dGTP diphosphatase